ncbi:hypothetical protein AVEN_62715-1 [Araneus ventricosus]|uniref:Uncharacterized protein n=1 Tax=Araneus ventricosus TaxID=182803 RepID=A0A4Y2KY69_ARAVE|nr:hypothetical protein AVEN_62715-1 [Araneus ventricosus]
MGSPTSPQAQESLSDKWKRLRNEGNGPCPVTNRISSRWRQAFYEEDFGKLDHRMTIFTVTVLKNKFDCIRLMKRTSSIEISQKHFPVGKNAFRESETKCQAYTAMRGSTNSSTSIGPPSSSLMIRNNRPNDVELNLIVGSGDPSMIVWDLDLTRCEPSGIRLMPRKRDKMIT